VAKRLRPGRRKLAPMDAGSHEERAAVTGRPYVLLSCAMSIDGYIDDATGSRLLLSSDADLDRVDEVRASCDAILVGAATIRADNPRLLVRSLGRQGARTARGTTPTPAKVTITGRGDLDPAAQFFAAGDAGKIVYAASPALDKARERVGAVASVADAGDPVDLHRVLADLSARGVGRLMVEGGGSMHTQFLAAGLADELQLVIAPFFVGDARAPRFVGDGPFPWDAGHRARLAGVTQLEDVVLLRYALSERYAG
jgi:5-amino-6-(5-phosphoribosylamino)uracil reductase